MQAPTTRQLRLSFVVVLVFIWFVQAVGALVLINNATHRIEQLETQVARIMSLIEQKK